MIKSQVPSYFLKRRDSLMKSNPGAAFFFPANRHFIRNYDVHYPFRQESNFYYLTGFDEPESALVLVPTSSGSKSYQTVLFVMERERDREIWNGERYGVERAGRIFGADLVYPIKELSKQLPALLKGAASLYFALGEDPAMDRLVLESLDTLRVSYGRSGKGILPIVDPKVTLGEMRLFKSAEEAELMRKAGAWSAAAHKAAMQEAKPGMNEFEIEALVEYVMRKNGCNRMGYGSIVAGGRNATCLHYVANNEPLKDGDLLLIDAGGEVDYYTADITRTFPVGRSFTKEQAQIYDIVLKSQKETVALCKPGTPYQTLYDRSAEILMEGVLSLGLLKGEARKLVEEGKQKALFPHGIGHWLGMDVHDMGLYQKDGRSRVLEPGMVITVEPGLYFQPDDNQFPERYRGIGIRIEDDVMVTASGNEVFTSGVPKERDEIEALRTGR